MLKIIEIAHICLLLITAIYRIFTYTGKLIFSTKPLTWISGEMSQNIANFTKKNHFKIKMFIEFKKIAIFVLSEP